MKEQILLLVILNLVVQSLSKCDEIACICTLNSQNVKECTSCNSGFSKDANSNTCIYDFSKLYLSSGPGTSNVLQRYCLMQYYSQCQTCVQNYVNFNGSCNYYCQSLGQYITDHLFCKPYCYVSYCDLCDENNSSLCLSCGQNAYLYNGTCVLQCPDSTVAYQNQCISCNQPCKSCTSPDVCSVCMIPDLTNHPSCKCQGGLIYYNQQCVNQCPLYYQINATKGVCERTCPAYQYPLTDSSNSQTNCVSVQSSNSDFCLAHLKNMSTQVSFKLQNNEDPNTYILIARVEQTPYLCYQFLLFGKDSFQVQQFNNNQQIDYFLIYYQFTKTDFQNPNYFTCGIKSCEFRLKLQWGNQIQYIFKTQVNLDITGQLENDFTLNGDYKIVDVLCEDCIIPVDQVIESTLQKSCTSDQVCTDSTIFANINSEITITQKITNPLFMNNIIQPHSLKLEYKDNTNGYTATIYIKSYTYVNTIPGQITYKFIAVGVSNGSMVITSIVKSAKVGRILADSSSPSNQIVIKYPQLTFELKMNQAIKDSSSNSSSSEKGNSSENSTTTYIIIIVVLCLAFSLGVATYCLYQRRKRRQNKTPSLQEQNNNINPIVEQDKAKQSLPDNHVSNEQKSIYDMKNDNSLNDLQNKEVNQVNINVVVDNDENQAYLVDLNKQQPQQQVQIQIIQEEILPQQNQFDEEINTAINNHTVQDQSDHKQIESQGGIIILHEEDDDDDDDDDDENDNDL